MAKFDFTANEIFSKKATINSYEADSFDFIKKKVSVEMLMKTSKFELLDEHFQKKIVAPWDMKPTMTEGKEEREGALVQTGDAETIVKYENFQKLIDGFRCECCGKSIPNAAYSMHGLLCEDCFNQLEASANSANGVWWVDL